jgi:TonB family protein
MAPENTYKWVQDRLRELHSGALSGDDLRRLHALAKEDPFIADALEGFSQHPTHSHDTTLDRLASRIRPVKRERRRWLMPNLTVTAVAASLMIIVGVWAVINRMDKEAEFAVVETSHEITIDPFADSAIAESPIVITEEEPAGALKFHPEAETREEEKNENATASASRSGSTPAGQQETAATIESVQRDEVGLKPVQSEPTSTQQARIQRQADDADKKEKVNSLPADYSNAMPPSLMARRTTGRVVSELGDPLIGVNLNIRNTNLSTASDLDGKFELFLPEPQSTVDVSFSGYKATTVELRQGEEDVAIQLPAIDLAGAGQKTYSNTPEGAPAGVTVPQQTTYIDYLRNNSRYPLKDNLYTPGRNVTLQFDVAEDGKPSRVRVKTSSNDRNLDDEALRLIRKGPVWMCEGNKFPCEMEYTIYFR